MFKALKQEFVIPTERVKGRSICNEVSIWCTFVLIFSKQNTYWCQQQWQAGSNDCHGDPQHQCESNWV